MILKSYELKKIKSKKSNLILFYGKNSGLKSLEFKNMIEKEMEVIKYEERDLIDKQNEIIENILSKSLFEKKKIILIKRTTDKLFKTIEWLANKNLDDTKIVFDADNLEKKSKIRSFFEKKEDCICVPFYPDNLQTLSKIAFNFFKEKKISISNENINLIVNKCNGSRENLLTELEKIKFFTIDRKKITTGQILSLINLSESYSFSELVDNCLAKNKIKTLKIINENILTNEDCIIIVRTLISKLKRNFELSKEYISNKDINYVISNAKPPIFWKDKEITKQQIIKWTPADIKKIIYYVSEIELIVKKNFNNSVNLITDLIIQISNSKINS